jgi:hypothetical protein
LEILSGAEGGGDVWPPSSAVVAVVAVIFYLPHIHLLPPPFFISLKNKEKVQGRNSNRRR